MYPYLCRIIATLSKYFKDLLELVAEKVTDDFNKMRQNVKGDNISNEKRVRNIKYICELCKFKVLTTGVTMNFLKTIIDDFS